MNLHPDFRDFLTVLASERVEALVIGGYAVSYHSRPRFTKDIDVLVGAEPDNRKRLAVARSRFGAPQDIIDGVLTAAEDEILWFGASPTRIDLLFSAPGIEFKEAYARRETASWDGVPVDVIGRDDLIVAKRAAGREQDLRDVRELTKVRR
jgi:hypothetical protein